GLMPRESNAPAWRAVRSENCTYVKRWSPQTTAVRLGYCWVTWRRNRKGVRGIIIGPQVGSGALASIYHKYVAVYVSGCIRSEKYSSAFQVVIGTEAPRR